MKLPAGAVDAQPRTTSHEVSEPARTRRAKRAARKRAREAGRGRGAASSCEKESSKVLDAACGPIGITMYTGTGAARRSAQSRPGNKQRRHHGAPHTRPAPHGRSPTPRRPCVQAGCGRPPKRVKKAGPCRESARSRSRVPLQSGRLRTKPPPRVAADFATLFLCARRRGPGRTRPKRPPHSRSKAAHAHTTTAATHTPTHRRGRARAPSRRGHARARAVGPTASSPTRRSSRGRGHSRRLRIHGAGGCEPPTPFLGAPIRPLPYRPSAAPRAQQTSGAASACASASASA